MRSRILLVTAALALTACGSETPAGVILLSLDGVVADSVGPDPAPCKRFTLVLHAGMTADEIRKAFSAAKTCP